MENHTVTIDNRERLTITDVIDIDSFDEEEVRATLQSGAVVIKGEKLHIQMLDLEKKTAVVSGMVNSLMYVKVREKSEGGFFAKIMK